MSALPVLTILRNGQAIKSCPIEGEAVLGRSEGCLIRLEDRAISRQHMVFKITGEGVQVQKKSEFAPLIVNGQECTHAMLKEGDTISIGPFVLKLSTGAPGAGPAPAGAAAPVMATPVAMPPIEGALPAADDASPPLAEPLAPQPALSTEDASASGTSDSAAGGLLGLLDTDSPSGGAGLPGLDTDPPAPAGEAALQEAPGEPAGDAADAPAAQAPIGILPIQQAEEAEPEAQTKISPAAKVLVRLTFPKGSANVEQYDMTTEEISIGRGKTCDIVLNDKKASRKNAIIRKAGLSFVIKDLDSANGTYVNGERITEQELGGDDRVRVGDVEFRFQVKSADYEVNEGNFLPVETASNAAEELVLPDISLPAPVPGAPDDPLGAGPGHPGLEGFGGAVPGHGPVPGAAIPTNPSMSSLGGLNGIAGVSGGSRKKSLFEKLGVPERLRTPVMVGLVGLVAILMFAEDQEPQKKPSPKPSAAAKVDARGGLTFDQLSPEQQRFVEIQLELALDQLKIKEYDKSLYEVRKIFTLINDYKNAREIEHYATEGQRLKAAQEEEQKKRAEELRLKERVKQLSAEVRALLQRKEYEKARELFAEILAIDPDNADVASWRAELDEYEEERQRLEQEARVRAEINQHAWSQYRIAKRLKNDGKAHAALVQLRRVEKIGATDRKLRGAVRQLLQECSDALASERDPLMQEAKQSEEGGELVKAFKLYESVLKIHPGFKEALAGIARLRDVLHEKAKGIYTEAILAEGYSDFATAKAKFQECLSVAPEDDLYHERAKRKLARYFKKESPDGR